MNCDICKDTGYIIDPVEVPPPGHRGAIVFPSKRECICRFNETVHSRHPILDGVPKIVASDTIQLKKCFKKHCLFTGDAKIFLILSKTCVYSIDRSNRASSRVLISQSLTFHETYTMPPADERERLYLEDTNDIDFMFLMFTSNRKSATFPETFAEVAANRLLLNKFLWIFSPQPIIANCLEYSDKLGTSFESFKKIDLGNITFKNGHSKMNDIAKQQRANDSIT